jgi:hypothetical protein
MSSVTSGFAQIAPRAGYFICVSGSVTNYTVTEGSDKNSWTVDSGSTAYALGTILQDMGEIARASGAIFRKVRAVTTDPAGGDATAYWIVVPGGEYPNYGRDSSTSPYVPAKVARLG